MNVAHICIVVIIVVAVIAIMYVALRKFGIQVPDWVIQIFWIVVVACVSIAAIKFVIGMF